MLPRVVALCGLKRCGKDTVAQYMVEKYGYEHVKFSGKLKQMMKLLFDFTDDQIETDEKDKVDARWNTTPRKLMQFFGTEVMQYKVQEVLPDIGRNYFANSISVSLDKNPRNIVISDMRFVHEYEALKHHSMIVVEVIRDSCIQDTHISENEYKKIPKNFVINNHHTLEDLYSEIDSIINDVSTNQTE